MANDIIDINVTEIVETVEITVNPNLTTVNINQITGGGGGDQDLQSVTDNGAVTTNTITASSIITNIDSTFNGLTVGRGNISDPLSENTAIGYQALQSVVHTTGETGYYNTAIGHTALKSLTTGFANDAFGNDTLNLCTTGTYNTAMGSNALRNLTTGTQNLAIGTFALLNNITGERNVAVGVSALMNNTGSYNTAIGTRAGGNVSSTGEQNIIIGYQAGMNISSGRLNLLIECTDGGSITTGSNNIILNPRRQSGITTGSNNTIIGGFNNSLSAGLTNNVIIATGLGVVRFQSTDTGLTTVPSQTNALIIADTTGKAIATKEYVSSVAGGATNLTTSQTVNNFTINSDTGNDAIVPLGNGTLAGATLNDYTTTEKTKLAGIAEGAEVNVNADWNSISGDSQILNKPIIPSITNLVPYTGATSDVNLGEYGIQLGNLEFDNTPTNIPTATGSIYYNDTDGTLDLILKGGNVKLQIGQESVVRVVNKTATNISLLETNYQAVRVTGAQGQRLKVDLAQATTDGLSAETIGLVTETIANNQEGFVTTSGLVRNINTTGSLQSETWLDGDVLYLSPTVAGSITKVKPNAPNHLIVIGYVIHAHATQGTIFVKVDNGYELDELHNVAINGKLNEDFLQYESATQLWKNKPLTDTLIKSKLGITTLSGSNTGDNATNTQYSGLATSKQDTLQSTVNIKSINGNSILGGGDLTISGTGISSLNGLTGATQTFSVFTNFTGSPSFASTGTNHQLRLPNAGAGTDYGLVTNVGQTFSGTKVFANSIEIPAPVPANPIGIRCIVLGDPQGNLIVGSTTLYPTGLEMQYVKGITSSVQTQLDSKASIIDVAEQTYSLSPTFTITAPTTIVANTYKWSQVGSSVTVRVNLSYTTAGSFTTVVIPLPTDMPTPLSPTGFTAASDILYYGTGTFTTTTSATTNVGRVTFLRRNAANNGYEFVIIHSSAVAARVVALTLQYFT